MLAADPRGASIVAFRGQRFESGVAAIAAHRSAAPHLQIIRKVGLWQRNGMAFTMRRRSAGA